MCVVAAPLACTPPLDSLVFWCGRWEQQTDPEVAADAMQCNMGSRPCEAEAEAALQL